MDFAQQLKSSLDIVNVIGEYVRLRKVGSRYSGLCPFHSEKTPSFSVSSQHQFFRCFGCDESGDVISFVMKKEGLSFQEALKSLAERNGIAMPKRATYSDDDTKLRAAVYRMHELAETEFRRQLAGDAGGEARAYLEHRGVPPKSADEFCLGYAPRTGVLKFLQREGFSEAELEESGLVGKREDGSFYDRFRNRLIFPIHNEFGKPIAFGGRALSSEDQPKYLNSPETKIYRKSTILYNLHRAKEAVRQTDLVILVEGYMDVIGVAAAGVAHVVASCGTALTAQQVQAVRRHTANIVVNFDPDNAGAKAAERSIEMLLAESMRVRILTLEGGLDPDEFCRNQGAEAYGAAVERATGYFHWLADRARTKFDMHSAEGRYAAFQSLLPVIERLPDELQRLALAQEAADYLGLRNVVDVRKYLGAGNRKREPVRPRPAAAMRHSDRILIGLLLSDEPIRGELIEHLKLLPSLRDAPAWKIYEALIALHDASEPMAYAAVHARLEKAEQEMLANALLSGDLQVESISAEAGIACLEQLVEEERGAERAAIKARIRDAERRGDMQDALRLYGDLKSLDSRG